MTHRKAKFELKHCAVRKEVYVGDKVISGPQPWRMAETEFHWKAGFLPSGTCVPFSEGVKELHAYFAEALGRKFARRFFGAQFDTWIASHFQKSSWFAFKCPGRHWRKINVASIEAAHEVLPIVQQVERDGLRNLIPAIIHFKKTPEEIRADIGRAAWRKIANNSPTRNKLISDAAIGSTMQNPFVECLDIRSGLMGWGFSAEPEWLLAARLAPTADAKSLWPIMHLIRDTMTMLGRDFNPRWSLARIQREHDEAARLRAAGGYSSARFADDFTFEGEDYKAKLLTSQSEVAQEGAVMKHCVASYARRAADGEYFVFEITGKERATLGSRHPQAALIDQLYGQYNSQVSAGCHAFARRALCGFYEQKMRAAA